MSARCSATRKTSFVTAIDTTVGHVVLSVSTHLLLVVVWDFVALYVGKVIAVRMLLYRWWWRRGHLCRFYLKYELRSIIMFQYRVSTVLWTPSSGCSIGLMCTYRLWSKPTSSLWCGMEREKEAKLKKKIDECLVQCI